MDHAPFVGSSLSNFSLSLWQRWHTTSENGSSHISLCHDPLATADPGGGGSAGARAPPSPQIFNVQTIFKRVSMCVRNLVGAYIDASAAVQRLCPYTCMPYACVASTCTFHMKPDWTFHGMRVFYGLRSLLSDPCIYSWDQLVLRTLRCAPVCTAVTRLHVHVHDQSVLLKM